MRFATLAFALAALVAAPSVAQDAAPGEELRDCRNCPAMIVLPGGMFAMGDESELARDDEKPAHEVTVAAFAIGKTEVTRAEYRAFAEATGREAPGGCTTDADGDGRWEHVADATWIDPKLPPMTEQHPVTCVNWADAAAYVAWLAETTGQPYRLATEAEWEYAVRAGSTTQYWWGEQDDMCAYANGPDDAMLRMFPRWRPGAACDDGEALAAPMASYQPNAFGLYDTAGNVWEWTADCYLPYDLTPRDGSAAAADACPRRALRGGSWVYGLEDLRSSQRNGLPRPEQRGADIGFRVARGL